MEKWLLKGGEHLGGEGQRQDAGGCQRCSNFQCVSMGGLNLVAQVSPKKPRQTPITMISRDVAESLAGKQLTREQPQADWGLTN